MKDEKKTKQQLLNELVEMRRQLAQLAASEVHRRQLEKQLHDVITSARCLLWNANVENKGGILLWKVHRIDEKMGQRFLPLDVYPGETYNDAWHRSKSTQDSSCMEENVRDAILSGSSRHSEEFRCIDREGKMHWLHEDIFIEQLAEDQWRLVGVCTDITDRKQASEKLHESNLVLEETLTELQETQEQLIQHERLRALGQMASGIAHDFNNALSPILGFSEVLLEPSEVLEDKEKVTQYVQTINTAAKGAASVVRRLREFYRRRNEREIFSSLDLNQLVEEAIPLTQPRWKDQAQVEGTTIQIEKDLAPGALPIAGNEVELNEVLTDLIFNAVDAMPDGGTLTLHTRSSGELLRSYAVLEVRDTGIGMTQEVRQRCIEPFFSTKGERGLGLSMVFGIVQRHEGWLEIESEPGQGTTFRIHLPAHLPEDDGKIGADAAPHRTLHVLVVEDEPLVRQMLAAYLADDGHTVETATNGREGLEKFHAGQYTVVITDRAMPEMNGDRLAAAIKQIAPNKPVIMLTGFGDVMHVTGEKPAVVDAVISKPVTLPAFRKVLAEVTASMTP